MRGKIRDSFALHKANTRKFAYERIYGNLFTIFEEEEEIGAFVFNPIKVNILSDGVLGVIAADASDYPASSFNI